LPAAGAGFFVAADRAADVPFLAAEVFLGNAVFAAMAIVFLMLEVATTMKARPAGNDPRAKRT
jgi:hypothetical protein